MTTQSSVSFWSSLRCPGSTRMNTIIQNFLYAQWVIFVDQLVNLAVSYAAFFPILNS